MKYLILLCLLMPLQAVSDSSVWRVSNGRNELFIGGTVHVLGRQDYPLPQEFERAYRQAQMLVLETDINAMNTPDVQMQLTQRLMYSDGRTLQSVLKPETFSLLKQYLDSRKISVSSLQQFKPPMAMISLMMMELERLGMAGTGVDMFFNQKAVNEGKQRGHLEGIEKQISILENMGKGHEDDLILSTLDDLKKLPEMMTALKKAWRDGNLRQLEILGIKPMRDSHPALYRVMLVDRNNGWVPKIEALLATAEKELVLVGSLHLAGKDGVLAQLEARGYRVQVFR